MTIHYTTLQVFPGLLNFTSTVCWCIGCFMRTYFPGASIGIYTAARQQNSTAARVLTALCGHSQVIEALQSGCCWVRGTDTLTVADVRAYTQQCTAHCPPDIRWDRALAREQLCVFTLTLRYFCIALRFYIWGLCEKQYTTYNGCLPTQYAVGYVYVYLVIFVRGHLTNIN